MITLLIMFLELSAKLYTSVFHHGLKVGELARGPGPGWTPRSSSRGRRRGPPPPPPPPKPQRSLGGPEEPPEHVPAGGRGAGAGGCRECSCDITARRTLLKSPFSIPSKSRLVSTMPNRVILQISVLPLSRSSVPAVFPAQPPLPRDVLALFEYELFYGGTLSINIYKERMYGQFLMVSVGCPHRVSSPQSSSQPEGRGPGPPPGRRWPRGPWEPHQ